MSVQLIIVNKPTDTKWENHDFLEIELSGRTQFDSSPAHFKIGELVFHNNQYYVIISIVHDTLDCRDYIDTRVYIEKVDLWHGRIDNMYRHTKLSIK